MVLHNLLYLVVLYYLKNNISVFDMMRYTYQIAKFIHSIGQDIHTITHKTDTDIHTHEWEIIENS